MLVSELKKNILENTLTDDFLILVCPETTFIADQYINKICENKELEKNVITSLADISNSALSLVFDYSAQLNILRVDVFEEILADYAQFKNTVVVCKKLDKRLNERLNDSCVVFDKLQRWQVEAYIKERCKDLSDYYVTQFYHFLGSDMYKLDNEIFKISLVKGSDQNVVAKHILNNKLSGLYDFPKTPVEEYAKVLKCDRLGLRDDLLHGYKIAPFGLAGYLLSCYRNNIKGKSGIEGQKIKNKIAFLSNLNYMVTNGEFDMTDDQRVIYILGKLLS